jgi:EAL domain-containing protein (putative c-di-GMP-specific phosphodiesterase class I)
VRTVVELARRLRLETVAEGVETEQQAQALADLGCHLAQGFRFARPLSPDEFDALLSRGPTPLSSLIPRQRCEVDDRQRAVS